MLRGIVRNLSILLGYLSIYSDLSIARTSRVIASSLTTAGRKATLLAVSLAAAIMAALLGWPVISILAGLPGLLLILTRVDTRARRRLRVRAIARRRPDLSHEPPADLTLARMGLSKDTVAAVLGRAGAADEVRLAELDQNNRVLSEVGDIELFRGHLIAAEEFRARSRNQVQIVIRDGVVALKKRFGHRTPFTNELIALDALRGLGNTPGIVAVDLGTRTIYQSFIPGKNLGSLLAERGTSVSAQHRIVRDYRTHPGWNERSESLHERALALEALRTIVDQDFVERLANLFLDVQAAGVILNDIKYGNLLLRNGSPYLCDFDFSRCHFRRGTRFRLDRDRARDRFNYMFGADLATENELCAALASLAESRPDLLRHGMYLGAGRAFGRILAPDSVTGRWLRLRRHLPALQGRHVLAIGRGDGLVALQMLRAGAQKATAYEADPAMAELTVLSRRLAELIDNRGYDLDLSGAEPAPTTVATAGSHTMILALGELGDERLGRLERALAHSPDSLEMIAIDCARARAGGAPGESPTLLRMVRDWCQEQRPDVRVVNLASGLEPLSEPHVAVRRRGRHEPGRRDIEDALR